MGNSIKSAQFLAEAHLSRTAYGTADDCFELGMAYSCGTGDLSIDLIEAHKWFNLAALRGSEQGQSMRAEIAEEMTARQIAEAQRQARAMIAASQQHAA
jgi:TPR repeat protein